jgi:hypothetical protein
MVTSQQLEELVAAKNLACAAAIDRNGNVIARAGDFETSAIQPLVSAMLGPYGNPRSTFGSLEGQILPQVFSQDDALAIVDKPLEDCAVILFLVRTQASSMPSTPLERVETMYRLSRQLGSDLRRHLGAPPLD